jgi:hypothetical protein
MGHCAQLQPSPSCSCLRKEAGCRGGLEEHCCCRGRGGGRRWKSCSSDAGAEEGGG